MLLIAIAVTAAVTWFLTSAYRIHEEKQTVAYIHKKHDRNLVNAYNKGKRDGVKELEASVHESLNHR